MPHWLTSYQMVAYSMLIMIQLYSTVDCRTHTHTHNFQLGLTSYHSHITGNTCFVVALLQTRDTQHLCLPGCDCCWVECYFVKSVKLLKLDVAKKFGINNQNMLICTVYIHFVDGIFIFTCTNVICKCTLEALAHT